MTIAIGLLATESFALNPLGQQSNDVSNLTDLPARSAADCYATVDVFTGEEFVNQGFADPIQIASTPVLFYKLTRQSIADVTPNARPAKFAW